MTEKMYIASIVYSVMDADGKFVLQNKIRAFPVREQAELYVDSWAEDRNKFKAIKFKLGTVAEVEAVA